MGITLADLQAAYRITWSLFVALEQGDQETIDRICQDTDEKTLLHGWHIVAGKLRADLQQHAETLGCTCGCDAWLQSERMRNAAQGEETGGVE
jgi:hypothetical protein